MHKLYALAIMAVTVGVAVADPGAKDVRRTLGSGSFTIPAGWNIANDTASYITIVKLDAPNYCILTVYEPSAATADLAADFTAAWNSVLPKAGAAPASTKRKLGRRAVADGGAQTQIDGTAIYAAAHVIAIDRQEVWVTTLSPDVRALGWCAGDLDKVLTSATATPAAPANTPAPPANVSITMADLVGKWGVGGGATITGGESSSFSEWYTFKADNSYTYSFQGRVNNHTIRETGSGTLAFAGDLLVFDGTREGVHQSMKQHLIDFQAAKDGSAVLTLLYDSYPATAENIAAYKRLWIREAAQKK